MTLIPITRDEEIEGPRMHAFVIGVGAYPDAKAGRGSLSELRAVDDLPSAADSAKLVCRWLLDNKDNFIAKLSSLEVLISDPADATSRYGWNPGPPIDGATSEHVKQAGADWLDRVSARPGDVAFFYCCGHGAVYGGQPILFLEDLNTGKIEPWAHLNLGALAQSLRRMPGLGCAFMFSDACGEFVTKLELSDARDSRFYMPPNLFEPTRNNVSFLCAASEAQLAHDATSLGFEGVSDDGSGVRFGRFTQTILKGLQGSSSRWSKAGWVVDPISLYQDLRKLKQTFFRDWKEKPFEPFCPVTPNDFFPIIRHMQAEIPLVVMTDPEARIVDYDLHICPSNEQQAAIIQSRQQRSPEAWRLLVPVSRDALYAVAVNNAARYATPFIPSQPMFDHVVTVT
ncbi:hypothetical protein [Rhizobium laguerreae]|uniref:hypothetical protein n=1 Tax=Rhizobium laguerreae TaxID=1076926 RepID=UPI0030090449